MKYKPFNIQGILALIVVCCGCAATLISCDDDDLSSTSIFQDSKKDTTAFDNWIYENYVMPYNIDLKYHLEDIETDFSYTLAPALIDNSVKVAHIVRYCWLQAYDEVAGVAFTRKYAPKVLQLVGSPAWESDNRVVLGQAESGMKITLYAVNQLKVERSFLNDYYFQTMHHEFTHILTQNKEYDTDFQKISENSYSPGAWFNKYETEALQSGFISTYAMSEYNEDFAETLSYYLIYSESQWAQKMRTAGDNGSATIMQKLQMVRSYLRTAWGIDIDELRDVVQRRMDDITEGRINIDSVE